MRKSVSISLGLVFCLSLLIPGCATHYYRVTDPATGKTYYTDDLEQVKGDGLVLKDARTGETVTIQNSEVREINKYEFDTARINSGAVAPPVQ